MQAIKQTYRQFLTNNFNGLQLKQPLFYNWDFGLRFDLQVGETNTDEYFEEAITRASTIFQVAFDLTDQVYLILTHYRYKRRKIRFSNFTFKQVDALKKTEISYLVEKCLYEPNDKSDIRNIAMIRSTVDRINYKDILTAIAHSDFPPRQPRLDRNGFLTNKEIYFVNINKKLIFHMYDDRGLDLISAHKEILRPIYKKHNNWILEFDREKIDKEFG